MDHEQYLQVKLKDNRLKLEHLYVEHQKHIAVFEAKRDFYMQEIDSIEKQLDNKK